MKKNSITTTNTVAEFDVTKSFDEVIKGANIVEDYASVVEAVKLVNESTEAQSKVESARINYEKEKTPENYEKLSGYMDTARKLKTRTDTMREKLKALNADVEKSIYTHVKESSVRPLYDLLKLGFITQYKIETENNQSYVAPNAFKTVDPAAYERQFDTKISNNGAWCAAIESIRYRITAASVGEMRRDNDTPEENVDYGLPQYKLPASMNIEDEKKKAPLKTNTAIAEALQTVLDEMLFIPCDTDETKNRLRVYNRDAARVREVITGYGRAKLAVSYLKERRFRDAVIECFHVTITHTPYVFEYEKTEEK